jgi:site-specific DNA recombinase
MTTNTAHKQQQTAVIYARVSSEEQVQGYSIQAQLRACREWAEKNGYKVAREYLDEGYSASRNLEKRESFKEMLSDAASKNHPFDAIVVHKLDRFSRDSLESFTSKAILKRHKVRLISIQEPVVGSDAPEDAFMEHILVGMAEFYSRNLSREIRKGLLERVRQGHLVFHPPFGYKKLIVARQEGYKRTRVISRPEIDPKAAPIVQRIYDLFDHGAGYKQIAQILNREGHRTLKGHTFGVKFVRRVLSNPAYIGALEYNLRQDRGKRDPVLIPGFYPAIIDEALYRRIQDRVKRAAANWQNSHVHTTSYLLSGLVVCGSCGHHCVGSAAKGGKFHYYTCQTYLKKGKDACNGKLVNKNKLETAVLSQIEKHVLSPRNVQRYVDLAVTQARAADSVLSPGETANKLALEDAQTRLRRWENALERGLLSIEDAARRIKEVRSEIDALVKNQGRLDQQRQIKSKVVPIPTELMNTYVQTMQARLKAKNVGHKREFLRELLREVKIEGDKITLSYRLPLEIESPPSSGREPKKKFFTVCQLVEAGGIILSL